MRRVFWCAALVMLLTAALSVSAKGAFDQIILNGPGLLDAVTLSGDDVLPLGMMEFAALPENIDMEVSTLSVELGEGYELQRQYEHGFGTFETFDRVRYFPDPLGGRGYVLYVGIENGSSEYDGHYYRATEAGEAAVQRILSENGVGFETGAVSDVSIPDYEGTMFLRWLNQIVGVVAV